MKSFITFILLFVATLTISAKGNNKRVVYTTTPQMHCQGCEDKIQGNLRFVKGVKIIQTNRAQQTVTITFDSTKCTTKDLEKAFKKIKYTVKEVDPNSLPSCCAAEEGANHNECEEQKKK
ncbi:MAG: heavy-metal-associated domain-containing protein [Prevotellaceae bacterium]|nr:heavy-metal-associated domain-containing protein [Candidatus Minthosoma caballi]